MTVIKYLNLFRFERLRMKPLGCVSYGFVGFLVVASQLVYCAEAATIQLLRIKTVHDYLESCRPLIKSDFSSSASLVTASVCDAYMQGILHGYMGTLAVKAEVEFARDEGVSVSTLQGRIDDDQELHRRISERVRAEAFICAGNAGDSSSVAKTVYQYLAHNSEGSARAYYAVLSALLVLYPCRPSLQ